jgi:hypothetical protein
MNRPNVLLTRFFIGIALEGTNEFPGAGKTEMLMNSIAVNNMNALIGIDYVTKLRENN